MVWNAYRAPADEESPMGSAPSTRGSREKCRALSGRMRMFDPQFTPCHFPAIEAENGRGRAFLRCHGHKREAVRLPLRPIQPEAHSGDCAVWQKQVPKRVIGHAHGQIAHV